MSTEENGGIVIGPEEEEVIEPEPILEPETEPLPFCKECEINK